MAGRALGLGIAALLSISACGGSPTSAAVTIEAQPFPTGTKTAPRAGSTFNASPRSVAQNPVPGTVLITIPLGITPRQFVNATNTAFAFGSLWIPVYSHPHGWLIRIDTKTNRVKARIPVGESPDSVAIVGGSVWVANSNGDGSRRYVGRNTLSRIDPRTNRVVETVRVEVGGPIAGGFGAVWVMGYETGDGNGTLRKIDARTGRIVSAFPLTGLPRVACGALWTADTIVGANVPAVTIVSRIDSNSGRRTARWAVSAGGANGPLDELGRCFAIWSPDGAPQSSVIAFLSPSAGVIHVSSVIPTAVHLIGGSFWSVSQYGIVQPLGDDGVPTFADYALPPQTLGGADWVFLRAAGSYWVVSGAGAFRVGLPGLTGGL